jgi:hypothetical protein
MKWLAAVLLTATVSAQAPSPAPPASKDKPAPVVLTGCVASPQPGTFTIEDEKKGRFQITGHRLDIYIGKRVEARGGSEHGLHITTGLYPSANAAAQAGADPVRDARAAMPGSPDYQPNTVLPTMTVTKIKMVKGACK